MTTANNEVGKQFDALIAKGPVESDLSPEEWNPGYYEAQVFGTDEDGHKVTTGGHMGPSPEDALDALRIALVFGRPDFKAESICVYECRRLRIYQG